MEVKYMVLSMHLFGGGGLKEITKTPAKKAGVPTKNQTEYLLNTSLERYCFTILLGGKINTRTDETEQRTDFTSVAVAISE
jgi:hypothetical protein